MNLEEYLDELKNQIRDKHAKEFVVNEFLAHIEDQAADLQQDGMDHEQALTKAVEEMGDPVSVGVSLDRIHRPHMEWKFLLFTTFISILSIGVFYLICTTMPADSVLINVAVTSNTFFKHIASIAIGLVAMLIAYRLDYTILAEKSRIIAALFLLIMTLLPIPFGQTINGSNRWLCIGGITLSIQALFLLYLPLFAGILYEYRNKGISAVIKIFGWMIAPLLSRLLYSDARGPFALFMLFAEFILFILALRKNWYAVKKRALLLGGGFIFSVIAAAVAILCINLRSYQVVRLQNWISHIGLFTRSMDEDGMLYVNSRLDYTFLHSNFIGKSDSAINIMKDMAGMTGDLILGSVAATCGIAAVVVIMISLVVLSIYIFNISLKQRNSLGYIVGCSSGILIAVESISNILIVFGLLPLTSTTLPFFTSSMSYIIVDYILLGLVLSIYRYKDIRIEKESVGSTVVKAE